MEYITSVSELLLLTIKSTRFTVKELNVEKGVGIRMKIQKIIRCIQLGHGRSKR